MSNTRSDSARATAARICAHLLTLEPTPTRTLVAIAGPPASGKSTVAELVVEALCQQEDNSFSRAALVPMDGYHLDNHLLDARGLRARKGAPETFDATGFCEGIRRLASATEFVYLPRFDRTRDLAIANSIAIAPQTPIVVVEGNYLFLDSEPWSSLDDMFTTTVFLRPSLETLKRRLIQRWLDHGLTPEQASQKANENDIPNAQRVLKQSRPADLCLDNDSECGSAP